MLFARKARLKNKQKRSVNKRKKPPERRRQTTRKVVDNVPNQSHKARFEQLLDDAVMEIRKK